MTEQQKIEMEKICRAMVAHFFDVESNVEEVQHWMKSPANCLFLIHRIEELHNILGSKEI